MTEAKLKVIVRAIYIRMKHGELYENIINSYPRLTEEDKAQLDELFKENQ